MSLFSKETLGNSMFRVEGKRLIRKYNNEELWVELLGENSVRVRATKLYEMPQEDWALEPQPECPSAEAVILEKSGEVRNGKNPGCRAGRRKAGNLQFGRKPLLNEYLRNREDVTSEYCSALEIESREFRPIIGGDYELSVRFESLSRKERIYGMGQYQQPNLDLKGSELELAHRNSQASVPFAFRAWVMAFCEQPGRWTRHLWHQCNDLVCPFHEEAGLLGDRWGHASGD